MTATDEHGSAAAFYETTLGVMAAELVRARLGRLWPTLDGLSVLGLGYPAPFLSLWAAQAYRCINATTSHHAPPRESCAIDALRLPFPDLVFDRVLVIHGVEPVGQDARLLREIWRVLKDDGRILVVAPNRTGLWAHADRTPFGQGQPYSRGQLNRLLASGMFRAERQDTALFVPPASSWLLRTAPLWESVGHALAPHLAGVTITEAVKDTYAAMPLVAPARRRVVLSEAA
jgi:SAM-dependent methyltransferase